MGFGCLAEARSLVEDPPMRVDPKDLFKAGRDEPVAVLKVNRGCGKDPFIHGYFTAAWQLCEAMRDHRSPPDTVIFPVIFMFRHALELTFKELLYGFIWEVHREHREIGGHGLKQLWELLQPFMCDWEYHGETSEAYLAACESMPSLVELLHQMDPDGQYARYEVTTSRKNQPSQPTLTTSPNVNLRVLAQLISNAYGWAVDVMADRENTIDYLSDRRGELGYGLRREGLLPKKKDSPQT